MSRNLAGRANVASRRAPRAVFRSTVTDVNDVCTCTYSGATEVGESLGSGTTISNGNTADDATPGLDCDAGISAMCTSNMTTDLTLSSRPATTGAPGVSFYLGARCDGSGTSAEGYFLTVTYSSNPANSLVSLCGPDQFTVLNSSFPVSISNSDTWEISAQGSTITAKHNGTTLWSVTDSSVPIDGDHQFGSFGGSNQGGSADLILGGFLVTPTP